MPAPPLTSIRAIAAAALAPVDDDDPVVLANLVDAVVPPALMLGWDDPWIAQQTVAGARGPYQAQLVVLCFAGRLEPGPGVDVLEQLVVYTITRLGADRQTAGWPLTGAQAPRRYDVSGISYLGARLMFRTPISLEP